MRPTSIAQDDIPANAAKGTTADQFKLMTQYALSSTCPGGREIPNVASHETNSPAVEDTARPTAPIQNITCPWTPLENISNCYLHGALL
jgi:hypothetical protein